MGVIASQFYSFFGDISQLFRIGFRTAGGVPEYRQGSRRPGAPTALTGNSPMTHRQPATAIVAVTLLAAARAAATG
jgi:hypothetical protein